jgi:hypothetical protein
MDNMGRKGMLFSSPRHFIAFVVLVVAAGCSPRAAELTHAETEPPWFEDVTEKVGLDFTHDPGPVGPDYFMPQIMGSGCAFLDFDGDGRLDIYLIHNGGPSGKKNQLFHQEADGTFRDVSAGSGLDVAGYGMGVAVGDVNNDGRPDVLLTEYGGTHLFLNQGGGRFVDISKEAGLDNPLWATAAAFCDFDRDGWLDLVVLNYLDYDASVRCRSAGGELDFCGPRMFPGTVARLYRNRGPLPGARFEDVTGKAGLNSVRGKGLGVLCADFNGDGWPDIFVANDQMANHFWINQHDGTFKEEALLRGVAYSVGGAAAANMGVAWADVDGDGLPDLFVTHLVDESHTLWKQETRGFFQDRTAAAGLAAVRSTGFGTALVDFNRNGWPDLVFVNGGVVRNRGAGVADPFWMQYAQYSQLFANVGQGKFRDISASNPALCRVLNVGRGLAVGDFDNDGAPDLLLTTAGGKARLLRNVAPANGHWLTVRALLPEAKRDAYGAEVTVRAGGRMYWRLLNPSYSYCSSNDPRCHFGLGSNERYDAIDVLWPNGSAEVFPGGAADRQVELRRGEGKPTSFAPRK